MIHYTQVTCLGTIKNSPTPIVCDLDRGVQLAQVINLPRSPLLLTSAISYVFELFKVLAMHHH